ncbi:MAG: tRNA (guanosine(46)-N7)-methyltransferase TrmB [Rhodospirillales bacterium]|nr:tRNA (guanosine(46)-N7)-methyltransferase TrmB [Rhodospirillales bacterium]
MTDPKEDRRFYGRRSGHKLRSTRQKLVDELLPTIRVVAPSQGDSLDPNSLFETPVDDIWVEIGFGGGEHLAAQGEMNPTIGLIGCEPFINGVASALNHINEKNLKNVRILDDDARPLLEALPDASIGRMFILFPDPWPKTKHHRRRFISPENLDTIARLLKDNAQLRFGSDHTGYVRWALRHLTADNRFQWTAQKPSDWRTRPDDWPETRYEKKALKQGIKSSYLTFLRNAR